VIELERVVDELAPEIISADELAGRNGAVSSDDASRLNVQV
jgi:hypothetical protein